MLQSFIILPLSHPYLHLLPSTCTAGGSQRSSKAEYRAPVTAGLGGSDLGKLRNQLKWGIFTGYQTIYDQCYLGWRVSTHRFSSLSTCISGPFEDSYHIAIHPLGHLIKAHKLQAPEFHKDGVEQNKTTRPQAFPLETRSTVPVKKHESFRNIFCLQSQVSTQIMYIYIYMSSLSSANASWSQTGCTADIHQLSPPSKMPKFWESVFWTKNNLSLRSPLSRFLTLRSFRKDRPTEKTVLAPQLWGPSCRINLWDPKKTPFSFRKVHQVSKSIAGKCGKIPDPSGDVPMFFSNRPSKILGLQPLPFSRCTLYLSKTTSHACCRPPTVLASALAPARKLELAPASLAWVPGRRSVLPKRCKVIFRFKGTQPLKWTARPWR